MLIFLNETNFIWKVRLNYTFSMKYEYQLNTLEDVKVILQNLAENWPNMGVAKRDGSIISRVKIENHQIGEAYFSASDVSWRL